ncbi:MAG: hypothetical protein RDV48_11095 [Candidatus Eremiobacteraeota bacterium]|nr:hypothetical protein [Candidatus Eremiobacteraeota bacterium]
MGKFFNFISSSRYDLAYGLFTQALQSGKPMDRLKSELKEGTYLIYSVTTKKIDAATSEVQTLVTVAGKGDSSAYLQSDASGEKKNFLFTVKKEGTQWKIDGYR